MGVNDRINRIKTLQDKIKISRHGGEKRNWSVAISYLHRHLHAKNTAIFFQQETILRPFDGFDKLTAGRLRVTKDKTDGMAGN